ncbi:hypothetical protein GLOIN_2v1785090 [Rhizophagus irregularis DAOM 181602=DAOM 197198]|nr:hypothetical protein GLOIN_2v1785090 [Rhizophagus irregularis DAOM 181602=DAOM 197198]
MTNSRKNKASGTSPPKRPAQSPPSGNVQGQGSSASTPGPTSQPLTDNSAKRTWVSSEPIIDQDNILTPPAPQETTLTSSPPPVETNASLSAPNSGTSLNDSQHSPSNSADKGKSVEILPPEPKRAASPDASIAAIQSSLLRFYAVAAPSTIEGFWTHFKINREACDTTDREFSSFSSYGSKATTQGSGDTKIIVIYFRFKPDMEKAIAAPIPSLHDLQFHEHDPSAKKVDEQLRTLVSAVIKTVSASNLSSASYLPDQRTVRRAHVALLAGLLRGSIAADLSEIAKEVSAKSVNIPFSYNSYNPKPYAYVHFSSAATKESAMGITCALKSIGFTWHEPAEVSSLCHRCGHPSRPRSSRSRSQHNNRRYPHHPFQSDLDHDMAAMNISPLMDWQYITEQITNIVLNASPFPEAESMNQGWDNIEPSDPSRLSDNLMDFSSSVSPSNGSTFTAHSHIPLPPCMSLIPGPATLPQDRLSSLTATVTELTKTVQQGMAQQKQFLAAHDNTNFQ